MIRPLADDRIRIQGVLAAPLFWNSEKSLRFLSDASDKLEREPIDSKILYQLEKRREAVGGLDWRLRLQTGLQEDLRKFRTYSEDLKDLLRAIRNKRHHQRDLTEDARKELGSTTERSVFLDGSDFTNQLEQTSFQKYMKTIYSCGRGRNTFLGKNERARNVFRTGP